MLAGVKRYIELKVQSKIGIDAKVVIGLLIAALASIVAFVFALVIAYVWLADRYSPLIAAIFVFGTFVLVAIASATFALSAHRSASSSAEKALARQNALSFVQPAHLKSALQIVNGMGWQKIVPLLGLGLLTAGLMRELSSRHRRVSDTAE
jgi:hypothetical protein